MSLQEEQARMVAEEQARTSAAAPTASVVTTGPVTTVPVATNQNTDASTIDPEEEMLLKQAVALSEVKDEGEEMPVDEDIDEEEAIARAIEMSMKQEEDDSNQ
jgi:26S proteasome regulatory subunit N10